MSHMWNPHVPPGPMPTHRTISAPHSDPGEREYFSQYSDISPAECDKYAGGYEKPTATVGTNFAWRSPVSPPGFQAPGSGGWLPQWIPLKHTNPDNLNNTLYNAEGRHVYDSLPRPNLSMDYQAHGDRGHGNYTYTTLNPSGHRYPPSYRTTVGRLPESDVRQKVSRREGKTRGYVEDLDKQRNRESSFHHPPIEFGRRQIRLVRILPTEPDVPIKCKFALSMVDNKSVRYTALSYTWGSASTETDIEEITLHKQGFWARRNLCCFLRQVRDDPALRAEWYWIDALCIDQAETGRDGQQEKNHQVNMMSQIYSNAHLVMTWLGEPAPEEYGALDALQSCINDKSSGQDHDLVRQGLRYLGDSSYWSRIWIIQELVLAKRASFRVGDLEFKGDDIYMMRLEARLSNILHLHDMGWAMTNVLDLRQDWYKGRPLDLVSGMSDFGGQKCSDPRDKIYGLLGLMRRKPCIPDYSKSCKDLYVEVVLWALRHDLIRAPVRVRKGYEETCKPCDALRLWSTTLRLKTSECHQAQEQLADALGDGWPLEHPWKCKSANWDVAQKRYLDLLKN